MPAWTNDISQARRLLLAARRRSSLGEHRRRVGDLHAYLWTALLLHILHLFELLFILFLPWRTGGAFSLPSKAFFWHSRRCCTCSLRRSPPFLHTTCLPATSSPACPESNVPAIFLFIYVDVYFFYICVHFHAGSFCSDMLHHFCSCSPCLPPASVLRAPGHQALPFLLPIRCRATALKTSSYHLYADRRRRLMRSASLQRATRGVYSLRTSRRTLHPSS